MTVVTATNGVTSSVSQFVYDGDSNRVMQILPNQSKTAYAGSIQVAISSTARITKTYYSAGSTLIAMRVVTSTGGNALYFLSSDHLGSSSLTTNASGNVVSLQLYDAWGNVRFGGSMPTDIGYTGQRLDYYIKLVQMGARWYDSQIGRWISSDSIIPDESNPQSLNRYSYVNNGPLNHTDPTGHITTGECGGDEGCSATQGDKDTAERNWQKLKLVPFYRGCMQHGGDGCPNAAELAAFFFGGMILSAAATPEVIGAGLDAASPIAAGAQQIALRLAQQAATAAQLAAFKATVACASNPTCLRTAWGILNGNAQQDNVFWAGVGAQDAAETWATANNATTLGQTAVGKFVSWITTGVDYATQARPLWELVSQQFANVSSVMVQVFANHPGVNSIWATIEYPALMNNPNVTGIIYHVFGGP